MALVKLAIGIISGDDIKKRQTEDFLQQMNMNWSLYLDLLYTYKKYQLILPIFLHKNTKSCMTLLALSDSVSPSSIVYPRRTTLTLTLYLGKTRQRAGI